MGKHHPFYFNFLVDYIVGKWQFIVEGKQDLMAFRKDVEKGLGLGQEVWVCCQVF
jgi:hypothetical protein